MHQARSRKGTSHSGTCFAHTTVSVRPLGCHVKNGSFSLSSMNCMSTDSIIEVLYHLNVHVTKHSKVNKPSLNVSASTPTSRGKQDKPRSRRRTPMTLVYASSSCSCSPQQTTAKL